MSTAPFIAELELPVNPVPLARARVYIDRHGKARGRNTDRTAAFYDELGWALKAAGVRRPFEGDLRLWLRFWRRCRSDADRGDVSNMVKAFEDAANGVLWNDDAQIVQLDVWLVLWGPDVEGRIRARVTRARGSQP